MKIELNILEVLVYYDLPHVFLAKDNVGTKYISLLVDDSDVSLKFIGVSISSSRISEILNGKLDLRNVFVSREMPQWYIISDFNAQQAFITSTNFEIIPEDFLPNEGFFLPQVESADSLIISEVFEKDSTVLHLSISEPSEGFSVDADLLGDIIKIFQSLVKYTFKKTISILPQKQKKILDQEYNYKLRAFASSLGSFKVHFETSAQKEVFGNTVLEKALHKIDAITDSFNDNEQFISKLQDIKGHSISSYKKLIKKIMDEKVEIKYFWYSPAENFVHSRRITPLYAERVYNILALKSDLSEEIREFMGVVKQADVRGNWRILSQDEDKEYSGTAMPESIAGITLDTKKYKFICEEKVTIDTVTDKEKITFHAISIEEISDLPNNIQ